MLVQGDVDTLMANIEQLRNVPVAGESCATVNTSDIREWGNGDLDISDVQAREFKNQEALPDTYDAEMRR